MARKKLRLAYIEKNAERKASFKKRKKNLMKKLEELCTLCDIKGCLIIYSQDGEKLETWPPSHSEVQSVISRFKNMSEWEQNRNMVNQESFIKQRIKKVKEQLKKLQIKNRNREVTNLISQFLGGESIENFADNDLKDMRQFLDDHLSKIKQRIEFLKRKNSQLTINENEDNHGDNNNSN